MLEIGTTAPDFTLPSTLGGNLSLAKIRQTRNVLLVFYPLAFTPV
ncbi:MAG: hypothetical protein C0617_12850 [Desulfuromonas sp.]|nr:MAG: hypothetical protein C0617_12850 [Desulfuromonas sp.]